MKKKIEFNFKYIIIIVIIIFILMISIILLYSKMINSIKENDVKLNSQELFAKENENHLFKITKIILYSNVDVVDKSEQESLQNLNLSQYTDIAIYIDNKNYKQKLTDENTIKELYIDNINISTLSSNGERILNYKNPYLYGKYRTLENANQKIRFNVLHTNDENIVPEYDNPTFYTDCSNPITLSYINKDVVTNYHIKANDTAVTFDGALLKKANIGLDVLNSKIEFCINIKNNLDEEFVCNVSIDNNLENEDGGLYTGYIMKIFDISDIQYNFIKLVN